MNMDVVVMGVGFIVVGSGEGDVFGMIVGSMGIVLMCGGGVVD